MISTQKKSSIEKIKSGTFSFYFSILRVEHHIDTYVRKSKFSVEGQNATMCLFSIGSHLLKVILPPPFHPHWMVSTIR